MKIGFTGTSLKSRVAKAVLAASVLACSGGTASAAVMTFYGIPAGELPSNNYREGGIAVGSPSGIFWGYPTGGQLYLTPQFGTGFSELDVSAGAGPFSLRSVDVSYATRVRSAPGRGTTSWAMSWPPT
jgi:hypothetical protein